jgi:hypothetical protein
MIPIHRNWFHAKIALRAKAKDDPRSILQDWGPNLSLVFALAQQGLLGVQPSAKIAAASARPPYLRPAFSFFQRARRSVMTASAPAVFGA